MASHVLLTPQALIHDVKTAAVIIQFGNLSASAETESGARHLGRGKPVALLAFLAASPGRRASRERLATLLWSEGSTEQSRQNLRQTLWYIRRRLGPWLQATDDFVELIPEVASDRDLFLTAAREHRLRDAVAAYTGPFIPDFAAPGAAEFEEWADIERRRLRAIFTGCCDTLARQALGAGQFTTAVELARRARDESPMELAPWRLLLESLVAGRDTVACLAEAEHLEAMLSANDLEPDDATRAALRTARATANANGKTTAVTTPDSGTKSVLSREEDSSSLAPELIGRETEFRALLERWEATKEGKGGAVLLSGVAGLGKSRLLADLHSRLRASRARAILIRANPGDRAVGGGFLAAVSEVVAQRPGARAISSDSASVLVALAPALASIFPQARPDEATGEDAVRRRVGALLDLLRAVSDESALALLIDDLHWVDPESRRVLDAAAARLEGGRVLMVLASRPPLDVLGGFAALPRFELARFDTQRIAEFVARLGELPTDEWAMELPTQLLTATQGIPLTLIETLQRLLETGAVTLEAHRWTSGTPARIAETLRQGMVLEARVRSLSPGAHEILLVLSTVGRPISPEQLHRGMASGSVEGDDSRLLELEHRGFVQRNGGVLQVSHDEVAAATVAAASVSEREEAHRAAAGALLAGVQSDATLRLAVEHAIHAADERQLREIAVRWVRRRRENGDGDSAPQLIRAFTPGAPTAVQQRLVRAVPWIERPARGVRRAVTVGLLMILGTAGYSTVQREPIPDIELFIEVDAGESRFLRVTVEDEDVWTAGEPLEAETVRDDEVPIEVQRYSRVTYTSLPDGSGWLGGHTFPDSTGDEVVIARTNQPLERPVSSAGDDGGGSASPDGRYIAFSSAKWHPATDLANLAIVDLRSREVRRVSVSPDNNHSPLWSPDGSRLAFTRSSFTQLVPIRPCIVHFDGSGERCDWPGLRGNVIAVGWLDDENLLASDQENRLFSISTTEGTVAPLGGAWGSPSPLGASGLVWYRADASTGGAPQVALARISGRVLARPIVFRGAPVAGRVVIATLRASRPFVDRVRVDVPARGIPVDQSHRLRLEAEDSTGQARPALSVRFWSLDDSIATVVNGTLRPRRVGIARVVGTVGGWRSDTAEIRIVPSNAVSVLSESWSADWTSRWRGYGVPQPVVVDGPRGRMLNPNGDGSYTSGAYLLQTFAADSGFGIEFSVSTPLTAQMQWQVAAVNLVAGVSATQISAWDHIYGNFPLSDRITCTTSLGGDGAASRLELNLSSSAGTLDRAPAWPELFDGRWLTLRLQLFPDGRCGLAIDGKRVMLSKEARRVQSPLILALSGHSVRTEVRFGKLEVWTGVKGGVDWEAQP